MPEDIPLDIIVGRLIKICGMQYVFTSESELHDYGMDETVNYYYPFDILVKPAAPDEISAILKLCNEYKIPVTPRGGGTGVTGGALPVNGGIVLSMERFNKIIEINQLDKYVVAESGVITSDLCDAVSIHGLYFPVLPSSGASCFIGGNVAENAGSINTCKYGSTAQYVLNLEVVLPTGEIIWTGANVLKNATGFNLTQLFVGSEGLLGIITKVVYKLLYQPLYDVSLLAAFDSLKTAFDVIFDIRQSNILPSAVELISNSALKITSGYLNGRYPLISERINAHLLISLSEQNESSLNDRLEKVGAIIEKHTSNDVLVASTTAEKEKLWALRYNIGNALTANRKYYRDIDICMPVSQLYAYMTKVEEICNAYELAVVCFGHAMDGNLHSMILKDFNISETSMKAALNEIYLFAISKGGVISGEHGVGLLQKEFMPIQYSDVHLDLMKSIKNLLDPIGILNPGKVF